MIHSSYYRPIVSPYIGDEVKTEIDRVQDMSAGITLNRTKLEEVGTVGIISWRQTSPSVDLSLTQLEYGSLEFYNQLANQAVSSVSVLLTNFKTSAVDVAAYKTDDDATFLGTVLYPKFRISGLGLNIGDPDSMVERTFSLVGEDELIYQNDNKYLINAIKTCVSGETGDVSIVFGASGTDYANYPAPVENPDASGTYMIRVTKYSSGTLTEMDSGSASGEYEYTTGTSTLELHGCAVADVYRVWYSATTYISGSDPFTSNTTDAFSIPAEQCSIYLQTSDYVYRLQSIGIDISLDRYDVKEIGNKEIVARGVKDVTTSITLGRILEEYTIEEVLRGVAATYGLIDVREFLDDVVLTVYCYSTTTKAVGDFLIGYRFIGLSPVSLDAGIPLNDYVTRGVTMEGEEAMISTDKTTLDAYSG